MLKLTDVVTYYGTIKALNKVNIEIREGEIVCLLGGNASGKTTTMKTILGVVKLTEGMIEFDNKRIDTLPTTKIVKMGISPVPEGRRIFNRMTVLENLLMGAFLQGDKNGIQQDLEEIYGLFPILKERQKQQAGTLSGGEQQMLATARALMAKPKLLLMDEPSMGLSPLFVEKVFEIIQEINKRGVTIFIIEQHANVVLSIANRGYVLRTGEIILHGTARELLDHDLIQKAYLAKDWHRPKFVS